MYSLNNVTTTDAYSTANTLECPGGARINLDIANAAIYYQIAVAQPGLIGAAPPFGPEVFASPSFRSLDRRTERVRIRSAVAGVPAQVTVEAMTPGDIG